MRTSAAGSTSRSTRSDCNPSSSEDRSHQLIQPFPRDTFPSSAERGRRVPQPFLHRSIVFAARDRAQNFDGVGEQRPQSVCDQRFQIRRGNSLTMRLIRHRASIASRNEAAGDVIAISGSLFHRMGRGHAIALSVEHETGQQARFDRSVAVAPQEPVYLDVALHLLPKLLVDDGPMFSGKGFALVDDLAAIDPVLQHQI